MDAIAGGDEDTAAELPPEAVDTGERLAQTPLPAIACAVGLLGIMLFETVLSGLRTYVFTHTASHIDVEPGSRLFRHLVTLPLAYFQARRVGDSVARVRELEHIRSFLTGNAITLVLDILFSVVFSAVMFFYSGWLTLIVVVSLVSLRVGYVW
jgi:subfamily B ATP-binding cassette protein HlyB/CyaB